MKTLVFRFFKNSRFSHWIRPETHRHDMRECFEQSELIQLISCWRAQLKSRLKRAHCRDIFGYNSSSLLSYFWRDCTFGFFPFFIFSSPRSSNWACVERFEVNKQAREEKKKKREKIERKRGAGKRVSGRAMWERRSRREESTVAPKYKIFDSPSKCLLVRRRLY